MAANEDRPPTAATTVEHLSEGKGRPRPLVLNVGLRDLILAHLRAWLPNEGCGLLASAPVGDTDRAVHFFPGTNVDFSPVRYTMDPREVIEVMKRLREEEWELAAIVHSHPRTQPVPSRTDQREWYYPEARLVIVSFAGNEPEFGCWALQDDPRLREFRPAPLLFEGR